MLRIEFRRNEEDLILLLNTDLALLKKGVILAWLSCSGILLCLPGEVMAQTKSAEFSQRLTSTQLILSSDIEIEPPAYLYPTRLRSIPIEMENYRDGFSTFICILKASGLDQTLLGKGSFTVFAPTNEAFAALPPNTVSSLLKSKNRAALIQLVKHHIVVGEITSFNAQSSQLRTLAGSSIMLKVTPERMSVAEAQVVLADISAGNGVIHGIEKVLLPPNF